MKADLNDVIECIEFEGELLTHYYNKNTGVIMYIEDIKLMIYIKLKNLKSGKRSLYFHYMILR